MSDKYLNDEGLEHLVEKIKSLVIANKVIQDNAASHNAFYVEEDITEMYNDGTFTQNVENGTFKDIFPGMYITKTYTAAGLETNVTSAFMVGDLDYFLESGTSALKTHHALMIMKGTGTATVQMNSTNTTTGGYLGSEMWKTTIPKYATAIENAFGSSHIVEHGEQLTKSVNTSVTSNCFNGYSGASSYADYADVKFNLFNNNMIYGSQIASSSYHDVGNRNKQIAAMHHNSNLKIAHIGSGSLRSTYWLSDVTNSTSFSAISGGGIALPAGANATNFIRGYFLLK